MTNNIIYMCYANRDIGMGHLMRGMAIRNNALLRNINLIFFCVDCDDLAVETLKNFDVQYELLDSIEYKSDNIERFINRLQKNPANKIVIDVVNNRTLEQKEGVIFFLHQIKKYFCKMLFFDSMEEESFSSNNQLPIDVLIVPYYLAESSTYKSSKKTKILAGVKYFPLRPIFKEISSLKREFKRENNKVLVSLSGGVSREHNSKIIKAVLDDNKSNIQLYVVGPFNSSEKYKNNIVSLDFNEDTIKNLNDFDFAIIGSGLMRYELSFIGLPAIVFSWSLAHMKMVQEFEKAGSIINGGVLDLIDVDEISKVVDLIDQSPRLRKEMSTSGKKIMQGRCGSDYIISELT